MTPRARPSSAEPATSKAYQCGICKESYSRSDHLIRHMSAHTKQRPFRCAVCSRAFARQDLLKRHSATHHGAHRASDTSSNPQPTEDLGRHGPRVQQACRSCASKKLRCSDGKPCHRCVSNNIFCDYEQTAEQPPSSISVDTAEDSNSMASPKDPTRRCPRNPKTPVTDWIQGSIGDLVPVQNADFIQSVSAVRTSEYNSSGAIDEQQVSAGDHPDSTNSRFLANQSGNPIFSDIWGCTFDLPNLGDFIQLNAFPDVEPLDLSFLQDHFPTPVTNSVHDAASLRSNVMGISSEAYEASNVQRGWNPGPTDHASQPRSLDLPAITRSEMVLTAHSIALKANLNIGARDKVLAMIYRTTSRTIWERMSETFASLDMLTSIIQHALLQMRDQQAIPFIHVPSFDVNSLRPELVGALITYGAVCTPSASVRKFGYAMHELVRLAVNQKLEDEEAAVRDADLVKAHYILLYLGFWSAISAKIELAESSSMLGTTMLRRGKFLQAGSYQSPEEMLPTEQLPLAHAWREWAQAESNKRLVYFAVHVDAQLSLARKINPLLAYSEVSTPLPAAERLWNAGTAEQWNEMLVHNRDLTRTALPANVMLRQPCRIAAQRNTVDTTVASAAALAGYWALVYDYRQTEALLSEAQDRSNFVLQSRYAELLSLLEEMKAEVAELDIGSTQVVLMLELLLLHLNVAYYDIAAYCGRGTIQEAEAAKSYVHWWVESEQSRHALLHAGQIFRLTRSMKPGSLIDISVVALYHATETLWIWGMMQRVSRKSASSPCTTPVALDAEDDPGISRFLRSARGQIGLTGSGNRFVPLIEPSAVANLANDIIHASFGNELYPQTTSEVSRIVEGFSRIGHSQLSER